MLNEIAKPLVFPSFVERGRHGEKDSEVISHWNPKRTGIELLDTRIGARHFSEALAFSREIRAPYFLVCILKEMRVTGIGPMERAFLRGLISKAIAGGHGPQMSDQEAYGLAMLRDCDIETIRGVETSARGFILAANRYREPEMLECVLVDWFRAPDTWVAEVVALVICGAAMKGALH
jgi:hypothetical protein